MRTYIITLFMLVNAFTQAADTSSKLSGVSGGIVINDSLQKLMEVDGVEKVYESCQKDYDEQTDSRTQKVLDCLWTKVKANPSLKKKVQDVYAQELKGGRPETATSEGRKPASSSKMTLATTESNVTKEYESDPAVVALSEYYGKKLDAILDPEAALTLEERKKNTILSVDHRQFIDLYKSELGKTIISAFTSYCLDTDPLTCTKTTPTCTISEDKEQVKKDREANLKSLKIADLKSDSADAQKWNSCIKAVTTHCKGEESVSTISETTKRSCLIMDYVKSARKNIIMADKQKEFYDDLNKTKSANIAGNMKSIDDLKKVSSDAVLEMSSTDVKTAMEKPINKELKDLEGCYKNGVIVNAEACKQYLNTNTDENNTALAELGMRQIAQEGILEEELSESPDKVRDYLKEEGYTAEQIKTMTADEAGIELVKQQIIDRFKTSKAAIIKEMADRIAEKTSTSDGKVDATKDVSKLEAIKNELSSRSSDLQNLVYFNNVVSSYLEVSDQKGNSSRNTASLFAEANSLEKEQATLMKNQIKEADLKDQKGSANTTNLDVDVINDVFLNYKKEE